MEIRIEKVSQSRIESVDFNNLIFGQDFSDHMYIADCEEGNWKDVRIIPYGNMSISPANSAIHYGQSLFEGMKANKDAEGNPWLFRPLDNWRRMNSSARRLCMPEVPLEIFEQGLHKLVGLDQAWIPTSDGASLYIRPFLFATDECVGVRPSLHYRFMIIMSPVPPFYNRPLKVKVEDQFVRAIEGGVGYAKAAGNYAASMLPTKLAQQEGYDQIIWLDGKERKYLEESGTTNLFFVMDGKLITPSLSGTILEGFTRDSIIALARHKGIPIEERRITIQEICQGVRDGKLTEVFGTGTAATVITLSSFSYKGEEFTPNSPELPIHKQLGLTLNEIKLRKTADPFGWMVPVKD